MLRPTDAVPRPFPLPTCIRKQSLLFPRRRRRSAATRNAPLGTKESCIMHDLVTGTRAIALVGPAGAGKTCLAEAMLFASGAIDRQGDTSHGNSVGDGSPEARARGGSTELNLMHFDWLGEHFAILDVPGGT